MQRSLLLLALIAGACTGTKPDVDETPDDDPSDTDDPVDTDDPDPDALPTFTCWSVRTQSGAGTLVQFDLATGALASQVTVDSSMFSMANSLALDDTHGYTCMDDVLVRFDRSTGALDTTGVECRSVASWQDGLLLLTYLGDLTWYATFEDALADDGVPAGKFIGASRLAVDRGTDEAYGAWHSTDAVAKLALPSASDQSNLPLEDYDTWVWGMHAADDFLLVLDDGRTEIDETAISVFNSETGENLGHYGFGNTRLHGLWCE